MPIAEITAALAGVKHASDIAKLIKNSEVSLEAAEIKLKLADLIDSLSDVKVEIAKFKEIISEKESEIQRLEEQLKKKGNILWEIPYYFLLKDNGEKDGPYCQKCYDSDKKLIRLQSFGAKGEWKCNECRNSYKDSTYKKEPAPYIPRMPL